MLSRSEKSFCQQCFSRRAADGDSVKTEAAAAEMSKLLKGQEAIPSPISGGRSFEKEAY